MFARTQSLAGRRVLITGAARGIGAALAERLHTRGSRVALVGIEDDLLATTAERCGGAHWGRSDVADRGQVEHAVENAVDALGGLDVLVPNAGVAAQLPIVGGDPAVMERTLQVNVLGNFSAIETDMTSRGFGTEAAARLTADVKPFMRVAPLDSAIDALERGIARRARWVVAPSSSAPLLPLRMLVQPFVDFGTRRHLAEALEIARSENAPLTTPQP